MSKSRQQSARGALRWRFRSAARLARGGLAVPVLAVTVLAWGAAACGLTAPQEPAQGQKAEKAGARPESRLSALPMARVPSGTFGPHLVMTDAGPFVAWAEPDDEGVSWHTMAPGSKTRLRLGPSLPKTSGMLSFFKLDRAKDAAILARVTKQDRIDTVAVTLLKSSGAGAAQELSAEEGEVLWVASVPQGSGARVLWARRRGTGADISAAALDGLGMVGSREVLRRGTIGWQAVAGPLGVWLATLEGSPQQATLVLTRLDVASPRGRSIEVAKDLKGADQVDLWVGDAAVVASWREGASDTPRLRMAEVDGSGAIVTSPRSVTPPRGIQSLLRLLPVSAAKRPWLAWEEPALDGSSWRRVLLGRLEQDGARAPDAWLDVHDASALLPVLAGADSSVLALTRGVPCDDGAESGCSGTPSGLTVLELGAAEKGPSGVAHLSGLPDELTRGSLCWDLDCLGSKCAVLCAEADTPTSVHFTAFEAGQRGGTARVGSGDSGSGQDPLHSLRGGPRMTRLERVMSVPALSDLVFGQSEGQAILSWVTDFDPSLRPPLLDRPAPDGRREPYQAEVRTLVLGAPVAAGVEAPRVLSDAVISHRARSLGGVSLSGERAGRRVLGWAALDQGRAHVFATLLDAQGKKLKQRLLSRNSGEVTDVQVVATSSGFLLFWIDDRSGRGQVYAQAVDGELNSVGPEKTLTTDTKDPIGLSVLPRPDQMVLAFADGHGDIGASVFVMSVLPSSLQIVVSPRAISAADGHAHSPLPYVDSKDGLAVMFIQGRVTEDSREFAELRSVGLDSGLRVLGSPITVLPDSSTRSFGLDCTPGSCRVVAVTAGVQRAEVWGAASASGLGWRSQFLIGLDGDAELIPPPAVAGDQAYLAAPVGDDGFSVERMQVDFGLDASSR